MEHIPGADLWFNFPWRKLLRGH